MTQTEIESLFDPDKVIDYLEHFSTVMEYYKLNHVTPTQKALLRDKLSKEVVCWLREIKIEVE